jgi:hypothetical protein
MRTNNHRHVSGSVGAVTFLSLLLFAGIQTLPASAQAEDPPAATSPAKDTPAKDTASKDSPAKESPAKEKESDKEPAKEPSKDATPAETPATKQPSNDKSEKEKPAAIEPSAAPEKAVKPTAKRVKPAPFDRPRQWLALFGVDDSYFDRVLDGQEIDESDTEALLRMLHAVRRFPLLEMHRLQSRDASWAEWTEKPTEHRGDIMHLDGKLVRVTLEQPVAEVIERFMIDHYYRCELLIGDQELAVTVFTLDIPNEWKLRTAALMTAQGVLAPIVAPEWTIDQHLSERASIDGFFFKRVGEPPNQRPIFISKRVAWHPHTPLGDLGMDVGLLDHVRMRAPLVAEDRECFYEMLAAVGRADNQELLKLTDRQYSVVPLFNQPDKQKGELVALAGTARRALRVQVGEGDADVAERFGMDGYYEIEMFTADSQRNPIIFCVREIPHGMPTGEDIDVDLKIVGFFMKTYAFPSQRKVEPKDNQPVPDPKKPQEMAKGIPGAPLATKNQLAPLLVGRKALYLVREKPSNELTGWIAGGAFTVVILGIWFISWRFNREGKKFRETTLSKYKPDAGSSFNDLGRR